MPPKKKKVVGKAPGGKKKKKVFAKKAKKAGGKSAAAGGAAATTASAPGKKKQTSTSTAAAAQQKKKKPQSKNKNHPDHDCEEATPLDVDTVQSALQRAVVRLSVAATAPVGRQENLDHVLNFITNATVTSNVLQLFGMPGTGKTAVIKHALHLATAGGAPGLSYVFLNGFLLQKSGELFCRLWQHLSLKRLRKEHLDAPDAAASALHQRFESRGWPAPPKKAAAVVAAAQRQQESSSSSSTSSEDDDDEDDDDDDEDDDDDDDDDDSSLSSQDDAAKPAIAVPPAGARNPVFAPGAPWRCIIVIDEVDKLYETNVGVKSFFRLLEWLEMPHCHCRLVTMANSMQLPDSTKAKSRVSTSNYSRITFRPYQEQQLKEILQDRIGSVSPSIFTPLALSWLCTQTAKQNGDVRRMLQTAAATIHELLARHEEEMQVIANARQQHRVYEGVLEALKKQHEALVKNLKKGSQAPKMLLPLPPPPIPAPTALPIPKTRDSGILEVTHLNQTMRRVVQDKLPDLIESIRSPLLRIALATLCVECMRCQRERVPLNLFVWRAATARNLRRQGAVSRLDPAVYLTPMLQQDRMNNSGNNSNKRSALTTSSSSSSSASSMLLSEDISLKALAQSGSKGQIKGADFATTGLTHAASSSSSSSSSSLALLQMSGRDDPIIPDSDWYHVVTTFREVAIIDVSATVAADSSAALAADNHQRRNNQDDGDNPFGGLAAGSGAGGGADPNKRKVPVANTEWGMKYQMADSTQCVVTLLPSLEVLGTQVGTHYNELNDWLKEIKWDS